MFTRSITEYNGIYHQCHSNVWAHVGLMKRRSIFEDIDWLLYDLLPDLLILNAIHEKRWPKYSNKDN